MSSRVMDRVIRDRIRKLYSEDEYDRLVRLLIEIEADRPLTPDEHVLKGRSIQLGSSEALPLEVALKAFMPAIEIDEDHAPALLEIGWYYSAVDSQPRRAIFYFEKVLKIGRDFVDEAERGREECLNELRESE